MIRSGTARRRCSATAVTVTAMKSILRASLAGAVAAGVFSALLKRQVAKQAAAFHRLRVSDHVPTVNPVPEADPSVEDLDLRVARNAPL